MATFCAAAVVTWALVSAPVPGDMIYGDVHSYQCFVDQWACQAAAIAANNAYAEMGWDKTRRATCERQDADANDKAEGTSAYWQR